MGRHKRRYREKERALLGMVYKFSIDYLYREPRLICILELTEAGQHGSCDRGEQSQSSIEM